MLSKKGWIISGVYLLGIVLLPPLLEWTNVSRRDSSVIEFVREFTNLVPLRGIMGTVGAVLETGRVVYLTNYAVQLLLMLPVGLLCGASGGSLKDVCLQNTVVLVAVYGLRLFLKLGSFDVDDILLNLLGLSLGWCVGTVLTALLSKKKA